MLRCAKCQVESSTISPIVMHSVEMIRAYLSCHVDGLGPGMPVAEIGTVSAVQSINCECKASSETGEYIYFIFKICMKR